MSMSYLVQHSAVGTLLKFATSGKISYRRGAAPKIVSPTTISLSSAAPRPSGSTEDVLLHEKEEHGVALTDLVEWSGPDDPSNPKNWPFYQKIVITAILW